MTCLWGYSSIGGIYIVLAKIKFIGLILVSMSTSNVFSDKETCQVSKLGIPFHGYSLVEGLKFSWKINLLGKCHTLVAMSAS